MSPYAAGRPLGSGYTLQEVIGRGSMAEVYRAVDRDGDPVAVKVLHPELGSDAGLVARFLQERSILVGLDAPNVVRVRDLVAEGDTLAIVMDLVDGPDLRADLLRRRTLPPAVAVDRTIGVLRGLAAVHAAGVIHRDIKPENIILRSGTVPMLSDFGISRLVTPDTGGRRTMVIGTPEYMAPEIMDDENPSVASDLYAVGVLLHEMLTGATPFRAKTVPALMRMVQQSEPERPSGVPDPLWAVISQLLSKDPARRPASAGDAINALERLSPLALDPLGLAPLGLDPLGPDRRDLPARPAPPPADTVLRPIPPAPPRRISLRALSFVALAVAVLAAGAAGFVVLRPAGDAEPGSSVRAAPTRSAPGQQLFGDDFERADATRWGPRWADGIRPRGGAGYGTGIDGGAAFLKTSDLGHYSTKASISMRANLAPVRDVEVRFTFAFDETESYPVLLVRANPAVDSISGYALRFERTEGYGLERRVEGVEKGKELGFATYSFKPGEEYSVAFQAVGSQFRAKVWPTASSEPTAWGIEATNTGTPGAGSVGLMVGGGAAKEPSDWFVDDFSIRDPH